MTEQRFIYPCSECGGGFPLEFIASGCEMHELKERVRLAEIRATANEQGAASWAAKFNELLPEVQRLQAQVRLLDEAVAQRDIQDARQVAKKPWIVSEFNNAD